MLEKSPSFMQKPIFRYTIYVCHYKIKKNNKPFDATRTPCHQSAHENLSLFFMHIHESHIHFLGKGNLST
jgi:hypothetical protein